MRTKRTFLWLAMGLLPFTALCQTQPPQLRADNIEEVLKAMTVEEKARICVGTGMSGSSSEAVIGFTQYLLPGTAGTTYPIPRLGIPAIALSDGPAGLRIDPIRDFDSKTYYCTHFPIGTSLASSWNTELVEAVGRAISEEVLEYGSDVLLAPALNIHRHPLCGRNFEYYSEDPVVSGQIAKAYVMGVQSNGVGTSIKHFAVNNQETNRMHVDERVSQRALREIYLKGFEIAIKGSNPWTVMTSYNRLNGTYTAQSTELLVDILRNEWGYKGLVMTDWRAGDDPVSMMKATNDLIQPGSQQQYQTILDGLKAGALSEETVNANVRRILELIVRSPRFKGYAYSNNPNLKAHADITRYSATEGMVLLTNKENTLPLTLQGEKQVAVYGCTGYDVIPGGWGSGNVNRAYTVSLIEGLRNVGCTVDESILMRYKTYFHKIKQKEEGDYKDQAMRVRTLPTEIIPTEAELNTEAEKNQAALIVLGRMSGEFQDRNANDFNLSKEEKELIARVTEQYHKVGKRVVVVLNIGGVIETASWKHQPDAILCAWQAGQEGGNSIADVLLGRQNPSGKLPMTFPINVDDALSSPNFPMEGLSWKQIHQTNAQKPNRKNIDYNTYEEDIYVGYRYFDTFQKEVSFPFGHGLSYTSFSYSEPKAEMDGDSIRISVTVKNTGSMAGKEVVQVYMQAPKSKLNKPDKELKAFAKTRLLQCGEAQTLVMTVTVGDLASFNEKLSAWQTDKGVYTFYLSASSRDIREKATVSLNKTKIRKVNNVLRPQVRLNLAKK